MQTNYFGNSIKQITEIEKMLLTKNPHKLQRKCFGAVVPHGIRTMPPWNETGKNIVTEKNVPKNLVLKNN